VIDIWFWLNPNLHLPKLPPNRNLRNSNLDRCGCLPAADW
jgi:hypothetical protein